MREYLGRKGNFVYLINLDTNECAVFNMFGKMETMTSGKLGYVEAMSTVEIDILSIIGDPLMSFCEIYFNGQKGSIPLSYSNVLSKLAKHISLQDPIVYRVVHPEGVMQVLLPCKKNTLSHSEICNLLNNSISWNPL